MTSGVPLDQRDLEALSAEELCCRLRKVEPLALARAPYEAWISGTRRDESPSRAGARKLERGIHGERSDG